MKNMKQFFLLLRKTVFFSPSFTNKKIFCKFLKIQVDWRTKMKILWEMYQSGTNMGRLLQRPTEIHIENLHGNLFWCNRLWQLDDICNGLATLNILFDISFETSSLHHIGKYLLYLRNKLWNVKWKQQNNFILFYSCMSRCQNMYSSQRIMHSTETPSTRSIFNLLLASLIRFLKTGK